MAKRTYRREVMERLFARSGNQCAFPGCTNKFYLDDVYVGQKCHVEATSKGGPRYNVKRIEDGTVDDESNLILLCPIHHKVVDSCPETFTPAVLKNIKNKHETEVARRMSGEGDEQGKFHIKLKRIFQKYHFERIFSVQSFDVPFEERDYLDVIHGYEEIKQLMDEPCALSISSESQEELIAYANALGSLISHIDQYCRPNGYGWGIKKREDADICEYVEITHQMMEHLACQYRKFRFED